MSQVATRAEARERGLTRYFTGRACPQGHISERYTSTGNCFDCQKARVAARSPDQARAYSSEYAKRNPEKCREAKRRDYWENRRQRIRKARAWKKSNKPRLKAYRAANKHKACEYAARRRARTEQATPSWADLEKIQRVYRQAQLVNAIWPGMFEVDHIVPLLGSTVCGLHVETNLRIVDAFENRSKGNSWGDPHTTT